MSRTRRRLGESHYREYKKPHFLDPQELEEIRRLNLFFYTDQDQQRDPPPWFRRFYKRRLKTYNDKVFRRWLNDPEFEPQFELRTLSRALWDWN